MARHGGTPENWRDFAPRTIRLRDDEWRGGLGDQKRAKGTGLSAVKPSDRVFHAALIDALAVAARTAARPRPRGSTSATAKGCSIRRADDDAEARRRKRAGFRTAKSNLIAARCIAQDGMQIRDLTTATKGRTPCNGQCKRPPMPRATAWGPI